MNGANRYDDAHERVIKLRLPSRLGYEKIAMDTAASLARRVGFSQDRIDALRTAIGEAVTNAIEHGNDRDAECKVSVVLTLTAEGLVAVVSDQGQRLIAPDQVLHRPCITDALQRNDKGGWGIWLIRELMDEVEFTKAPSGGNRIRMVIHFEPPPLH